MIRTSVAVVAALGLAAPVFAQDTGTNAPPPAQTPPPPANGQLLAGTLTPGVAVGATIIGLAVVFGAGGGTGTTTTTTTASP